MTLGPETADGTLVIIVCRAKHLPNRRKLDKQSPYVTMRIGPTAKKTPSHFRAGQTPEWTHEIRFQLTRERKPIMKLDVLDETKNEPTPIGQVEIDCSIVFSDPENKDVSGKYIYDTWFDLTLNGRAAGTIYLEMTFYPSAPVLPPKVSSQMQQSSQQHEYHITSEPVVPTTYDHGASSHYSQPSYHSASHSNLHSQMPPQMSVYAPEPPPIHPSKSHGDVPRASTHEVFQPANTSPSSHKKLHSIFTNTLSSHLLHSNQPESLESTTYEVDIRPESGSKSKFKKFNKLKSKFQAKQPIGTLFAEVSRSPSPEKNLQAGDLEEDVSPSRSRKSNKSASTSPIRKSYYQLPLPDIANGHGSTSPKIRYSDDEDDYESLLNGSYNDYRPRTNLPPNPPPHLSLGSNTTQESGSSYARTFASSQSSYRSSTGNSKSPQRKPPPPINIGSELADSLSKVNINHTTSIPFSADSIGVDETDHDDIMPTKVFMFDQQIKSLSHSGRMSENFEMPEDNEMDYHAPTPNEHLSKTLRLQNGYGRKNDVMVDLRTDSSGYLGDGKWQSQQESSKFSPSVFDRMPSIANEENKPAIPPKIPKGLSEIEYYVLEKEKYLRDINGRRA